MSKTCKVFKKLHVVAITSSSTNMEIFAVFLSLGRICPLLAFWGTFGAVQFRCLAR